MTLDVLLTDNAFTTYLKRVPIGVRQAYRSQINSALFPLDVIQGMPYQTRMLVKFAQLDKCLNDYGIKLGNGGIGIFEDANMMAYLDGISEALATAGL